MEPFLNSLFLVRLRKRGGRDGWPSQDFLGALVMRQAIRLTIQPAIDLACDRLELSGIGEVIEATAIPIPPGRTTGEVGTLQCFRVIDQRIIST